MQQWCRLGIQFMLTMNHSDWQGPIEDCIFQSLLATHHVRLVCCGLKQMGWLNNSVGEEEG